jgi:ElaB/YqjD/DUF883 family membrane-anchored ribosome-binding protein
MLGLSSHPRLGLSTREIERRLRFLEEALERGSGRVSASTGDATDRLGEILAAALSSVAERFRGGAHLRGEAARLSHEVEHRPLATIAVAVGVGIFVGLMMNRR